MNKKELTVEQRGKVNQKIAEFMGWTKFCVIARIPGGNVPLAQGWIPRWEPIPDYCSPDSPRRLLEEVEEKIKQDYAKRLCWIKFLIKLLERDYIPSRNRLLLNQDSAVSIATAPAEVRATAIFQALGGNLDG